MIKLGASVAVSDYRLYGGMDEKNLQKEIRNRTASQFAELLSETKEFQDCIVKRDRNAIYGMPGETVYETRMYLITPDEAKDFEEFKMFRDQMKRFVK